MPREGESCRTCLFHSDRWCHRESPRRVEGMPHGQFPVVLPGDWCGEYVERERETPTLDEAHSRLEEEPRESRLVAWMVGHPEIPLYVAIGCAVVSVFALLWPMAVRLFS